MRGRAASRLRRRILPSRQPGFRMLCRDGVASHRIRAGRWDLAGVNEDLLTHIVQNGRRRATSGDGWPEGGTMDTSRGHDGPIDSRDDRQLRSVLGRHIMIWRQTWRQMWRPSKRHHQPIDTTRDRDARPARCVADGGLAFSAAGDHRCVPQRLRVQPHRGRSSPTNSNHDPQRCRQLAAF